MATATPSFVMDLDGHVPGFGSAIPTGMYAAKIAKAEPSTTDKGNRIKFTFAVTAGEQKGRTVNAFLYIIDADFAGSDGHRSVTLDNWYNLLVAVGVKPGKADMRKLAAKLVGRAVGLDVKQQEPDDQGRVFSNVNDFLPPAAVTSEVEGGSSNGKVEEADDEFLGDSEEIGAEAEAEASASDEDDVTTFDMDDLD